MLTTIVFDWGDTLMQVLPECSGAMVAWPRVAAVSGAENALEHLQAHYNLVVATNAADSTPQQVRQALDRVSLGRFISTVFTSAECAAIKPDPAFFQAVQSALGLLPSQLCMVGDSYRADVLGAQRVGWSALWYNPARRPAPGLLPLQDGELSRLEDLPALLAEQEVPGYAACLAMLQEQGLSHNLLAHVHGVAAAAYQIALWLRDAGQPVDPLLVHRAGLLHDLAKLKEARDETGPTHAELAAILLTQRGYPRLAEIARRHQLNSLTDPASRPETWEQKLVYFADKIIEAGGLATIQERIAALCLRYPEYAEVTRNTLPALEALQQEICAALGIPASDLIPRLKLAFSRAENAG